MTVSKIASGIYQAAKAVATGEWDWRMEWSKAMKNAWLRFARQVLVVKVENLIAIKNVEFANSNIESAMTDREKELTREIAYLWSQINSMTRKIRSFNGVHKKRSNQSRLE